MKKHQKIDSLTKSTLTKTRKYSNRTSSIIEHLCERM